MNAATGKEQQPTVDRRNGGSVNGMVERAVGLLCWGRAKMATVRKVSVTNQLIQLRRSEAIINRYNYCLTCISTDVCLTLTIYSMYSCQYLTTTLPFSQRQTIQGAYLVTLLWPWPWSDDLDIRKWPRYFEDAPAYEKNELSGWRLSKVRAQTEQTHCHTQTDMTENISRPRLRVVTVNSNQSAGKSPKKCQRIPRRVKLFDISYHKCDWVWKK